MTWIALKMLTGDRGKYFAIIFGVTFSSLLIAEQSAIFCGVMLRTTSQIRDIEGVDIWVMNSNVRYIDDLKAISDDDVFRVRSVSGVGLGRQPVSRLGAGPVVQRQLPGADLDWSRRCDACRAPNKMLVGKIGDLQNRRCDRRR